MLEPARRVLQSALEGGKAIYVDDGNVSSGPSLLVILSSCLLFVKKCRRLTCNHSTFIILCNNRKVFTPFKNHRISVKYHHDQRQQGDMDWDIFSRSSEMIAVVGQQYVSAQSR